MTAENPDHLDARRWLANARRWIRTDCPPVPHRWKVEDFKLAWLLRDQFTRDQLLAILDIATGKRYDRAAGIETFLRMMAAHIDGLAQGE